MEVLSSDCTVIYETSLVIKRWEDDFKGLFTADSNEFDDTFYRDVCLIKRQIENDIFQTQTHGNEDLNAEIKLEEVQNALCKSWEKLQAL